jgi:hypothetical protein
MSNFLGDLFWNYLGKYLEILTKIPETIVKTLAKGAIDEAKREIALKSLDEKQFKTPEIQEAVRKLKESWRHSPEGGSDIGRDLISIVSGRAALVQLEYIAGVAVKQDSPVSARMFDQIAVITDISILSNTLKIIGSLIPTTNAQYMGIALDDYISSSGLSQITGFGYGMLFSNVVSPLVAYELNAKMRPSLPMSGEAIRLGYRKFLTDAQVSEILSKYGFSAPYQDALKKGFLFYPQAQDFIRFAVRDTFRPDIVAKYGYDQEYPSEIDKYIDQAGLSKEWMTHFWRAHWELPSVQLGYEMLHRSKITLDELRTLLRISDMAPWWIDKIIDVSYSPYTRVDVRRLFKDGIITREQVHRNHLDIGYDEEHAANLTKWVCKEVTAEKKEKNKDLTEAAMTRAYIWGQTDAKTFTEQLIDLNYDETEAKFVIALADYKNFEDELAFEWRVLKAEYLAELKNDSQVSARLTELKLSLREQEKWIRNLKREKRISDVAAFVAAEKKKATVKKV